MMQICIIINLLFYALIICNNLLLLLICVIKEIPYDLILIKCVFILQPNFGYKKAKLSALCALDPGASHCSLAATKVLVTGHGPEVSLF